jgi:Protein of unknown function (DUF2510)
MEAGMSNQSPTRSPDRTDAAAGWYPDPYGRHQYRYWDGRVWTDAVSHEGIRGRDVPDRHGDAAVDQSHETSRAGGGFVGFWTSLPGVLTAIAAVITAAGTIWISTRGDAASTPVVVAAEDLGVDEIIEDNSDSSPSYSDFTTVTDDSGTIVVDVPVEWTDVNGEPFLLDDGTEIPDVTASSDLGAGLYAAPSVGVSATDTNVTDVPTAMAELAPSDCTSAGSEAYDDPVFEGEIAFFTDCGGTETVYLLLAAEYKPDPERIALVRAQILSDRDIDAVIQALDTFNFTS